MGKMPPTSGLLMNYDSTYLDLQYNNGQRVPHYMDHITRWRADSEKARQTQPCSLHLAYGASAAEQLDVFTSAKHQALAPVLVFIHGGYWRSMDKADHSFVAPAFTREGACVVIPNYALCPSVTMDQLILQVARSLAWVWRNIERYGGDPSRITVMGHSAGGHLAAMMLACQWPRLAEDLPTNLVRNALSLSGLHDLEPIMHTPYLQKDLHLTTDQVKRCSPAYFPAPQGQLIALCGGHESEEFLRQNALLETAWGKRCVITQATVPGCDHFSVLEQICTPGSCAHSQLCSLLQQ